MIPLTMKHIERLVDEGTAEGQREIADRQRRPDISIQLESLDDAWAARPPMARPESIIALVAMLAMGILIGGIAALAWMAVRR